MINKKLLAFALLVGISFTAAAQAEEFLDNRCMSHLSVRM